MNLTSVNTQTYTQNTYKYTVTHRKRKRKNWLKDWDRKQDKEWITHNQNTPTDINTIFNIYTHTYCIIAWVILILDLKKTEKNE